jgi:hypothetical protein
MMLHSMPAIRDIEARQLQLSEGKPRNTWRGIAATKENNDFRWHDDAM